MPRTANAPLFVFPAAPALDLDRPDFRIPANLGFRMVLEALAGLVVLLAVWIAILD